MEIAQPEKDPQTAFGDVWAGFPQAELWTENNFRVARYSLMWFP
jgi:hypothetical protein